ncbi:hemerythrin domain-containing protein [Halomonas sp. HP20-15]|uniref:hemerythrin domain-containing protein n=1 Tax=Halomonas sp. HP20-15 TaxID=3085901 RepID=UPI002980C991|nr:hemerythrin domain-containing protein [Halomonas sp. HP20-15]MDW5375335.1 hemerythrin domain-containing protein [Halomonas sp. HP20-15]
MSELNGVGQGADVTEILTTDHREMMDLIGQIEGTTDSVQRRDLADTLIAEVMRHSVAEEMYVYPVMEKQLPNGADEADHDRQEHDEIVQVMKQIEDANATDPAFMERIGELKKLLDHHADDEESDQFPKLRSHLSASDLIDMGNKVQNAKSLAPTRPHPSAPHSELFHKSVGPGVGMIDRLRDKLTGRQTG